MYVGGERVLTALWSLQPPAGELSTQRSSNLPHRKSATVLTETSATYNRILVSLLPVGWG